MPEATTSPDYTCWTLYSDAEILASVLTEHTATEEDAWHKLRAERVREGNFWDLIECIKEGQER